MKELGYENSQPMSWSGVPVELGECWAGSMAVTDRLQDCSLLSGTNLGFLLVCKALGSFSLSDELQSSSRCWLDINWTLKWACEVLEYKTTMQRLKGTFTWIFWDTSSVAIVFLRNCISSRTCCPCSDQFWFISVMLFGFVLYLGTVCW